MPDEVVAAVSDAVSVPDGASLMASLRLEPALRALPIWMVEALAEAPSSLDDFAATAPTLIGYLRGTFTAELERRATGAAESAIRSVTIPAHEVAAALDALAQLYIINRSFAFAGEMDAAYLATFFGRLFQVMARGVTLERVPSANEAT